MLSADARWLVYVVSPAENPYFCCPDHDTVLRRDLATGLDEVLTERAMHFSPVSPDRPAVAISADGNLVAFQSGTVFVTDIFLRDMRVGTNILVSVGLEGTGGGNGISTEPLFSPDGRWLLFRSTASNLTPAHRTGLFARDLLLNTTVLVNPFLVSDAVPISVSADSRYVASVESYLGRSIDVFDLLAGTTSTVCTNCTAPSLTAEGRWLASEERDLTNAWTQIYVHDRKLGTRELISLSTNGAPGRGDSRSPAISYNGRFVVFASRADDLVDDDHNHDTDIFVRDRFRNVTMLISVNRAATGSGNGRSTLPTLAADGRTVLFQSLASDLVAGDYNDTGDVFVLRLGGPDSDGDGMEDDWELAYFGSLEREGSGDLDGDGVSDRAEFQAGTDPTNQGSVLQAITVQLAAGGPRKIFWSAVPGRRYSVESKDAVTDPAWTSTPESITAFGTTGVWEDTRAGAAQRFYRVVLLP
jgi:Tol biopolymer transport system component